MKKTKLILIAFFALLAAVACKKEDVKPAPVASFTISPNDTIDYGDAFTFTNTSTDASSYSWNFGDGSTTDAVSPSKTYVVTDFSSAYISFNVTLTATEGDKSSTVTKAVTLALPL